MKEEKYSEYSLPLYKWTDELSIESVVSKLLHMQPTEENYFEGLRMIKHILDERRGKRNDF